MAPENDSSVNRMLLVPFYHLSVSDLESLEVLIVALVWWEFGRLDVGNISVVFQL